MVWVWKSIRKIIKTYKWLLFIILIYAYAIYLILNGINWR